MLCLAPPYRALSLPLCQRDGRHSAEEGVGEFPIFTPFVPLGDFVRDLGPAPSKEAVAVYLERMAEKGWQMKSEARGADNPRGPWGQRSPSSLAPRHRSYCRRDEELTQAAIFLSPPFSLQFSVVLDAAAQGAFEDKGTGKSGGGGAKKREAKSAEPDETSVWFENPGQARRGGGGHNKDIPTHPAPCLGFCCEALPATPSRARIIW